MDQIVSATVEIAQGKLQGVVKDGVLRFNGIPYAKPPVGALRWQPPQAADGWAGVRDASKFGNICPQVASAAGAVLGGTPGTRSEDCLYLNIQTPGCDGAKRAVMVWIHGGAFVTGAGSVGTYNGKYLVPRGDIVLVTINYRLGAFGFLNLRDASGGKLPGTGAEGLADQVMALRWVKDNIAQFGGDPDNVTIFGESAGGMSVGALLGMPSAKGLFHKAIPQSGASDIGTPREATAKTGKLLLDKLNGVDPREAPWEAILEIQKAIIEAPRESGGMPFGPTADGAILPGRAIDAVAAGSAAGVPVMTGTTRDEWNLFTIAAPNIKSLDEAGLRRLTTKMVGEAHVDAVLSAYTEGTPFERWNAINTDHTFFVPATRLLDAQEKHAPVYAYRFDWPSPMKGLGSCHALELGFMFGTMRLKGAAPFFGAGEEAEAVSDAMMDAWIAFAKSGNPSNDTGGAWLRYDSRKRATMIFGDGAPKMTSAPNEARRKAWSSVAAAKIGA
ncbi:MAG: carboxylesterase/lipase family protein [Alphaproteobacteria bacterium]|nr:carboxylesterase/lipase family protein [Alphaproteobacteria bacterium]MBV9904211.1 carboxylesterase/lipase family protein [Alphaproteobacteria bacterium]